MRLAITLLCFLASSLTLLSQVDARLFQYPDMSATHITFVYAGDIWIGDKEGGTANKLSSPEGNETYPRFSPDGRQIAFAGNYNGNTDIYVVPAMGGQPLRLTYHSMGERPLGWSPDGEQVLFASSRESGRQRYSQFFTIPADGGMAERLPVPYGEIASFSPDGKQLAYTPKSRANRTWKRYRGGMAPDIHTFNLETMASEVIAADAANDEYPMWHGDKIYFLSDRSVDQRYNIWVYDTNTRETRQLTNFKDFDVHYPSIGPADMVFEAGGDLYRLDLESGSYEAVQIKVVTDNKAVAPRSVSVASDMRGAWPSPKGKRVVVAARGELFSLPAEHGYVSNMTRSSGAAERYPAWSPNGRYVAYWSDASGEYELHIRDLKEGGQETKLTSYGPGFRYQPHWSPDSKKIAFMDETLTLRIFDMDSKRTTEVAQNDYFLNHGGLASFHMDWSADSRWLTFSMAIEESNNKIYLYDLQNAELRAATSGYYNDTRPVFDPEGKYLYFLTNRHFSPLYSDFDNSFVYPNATQIAAVTLRKEVASSLAPRNDTVEMDEEQEDSEEGKTDGAKEDAGESAIEIEFDGLEQRVVLLPMNPGNYAGLAAAKGKVIYHRAPNSGSQERQKPLKYFDLEEREEKTIIDEVDGFNISADRKKLLVIDNGKLALIAVAAGQKMENPLPTDEMTMRLEPRAEWRQIFADAWRFQRDMFYDPGMHGVDWQLMRERYGVLIEDAVTRSDVNFILGELIAELNASHTYRGGGDTENPDSRNVGYLGVDWEVAEGHYRIARIISGGAQDAESRSPLHHPGVEVSAGDYVLAVNGIPLRIDQEPYAAFDGLADKTAVLTVSSDPDDTSASRQVTVTLLGSETRLRHLAWIEANRKMVEEASDGQIGYIYVRSTGIDGQNELVRQFQAQYRKPGMIIDERFNSGGQIPDRFVELLDRKPLAYWDVRHGKSWQWPPAAHFGPKAMLINGWSGSGGDAFPDYFRKRELGPLIGKRTWGGLIGISGAPTLVDGGSVTVPTFRMYDPDGEWFKEGYGVAPDIEVDDDPTALARGEDPQLQRAVQEVLRQLREEKASNPDAPQVENRSRR